MKVDFGVFPEPDFMLKTMGATEYRYLKELVDEKFLLLHVTSPDYFSQELVSLEDLYRTDDVEIAAVLLNGDWVAVREFVRLRNITFPIFFDTADIFPGRFKAAAIPASFLLTPEGKVVYFNDGARYRKDIIGEQAWDKKFLVELLDNATTLWEKEWRNKNPLVDLADYGFLVRKRYYEYDWTEDPACRVRKEVAEALLDAQECLQKWAQFTNCYRLVIWDGYRDFPTHRKMVESFRRRLRAMHPGASPEFITAEVKKYASTESRVCLARGSNRIGEAVDLTIADEYGDEIWMGTDHDDLTKKAHPYYFDKFPRKPAERDIHDWRMLFREVMEDAGFRPHPDEWWHFGWFKTAAE